MTLHRLLPLLLVALVTAAWIGDKSSQRVAAGLNRIARVLFGRFISPNSTRERRIEAAFIDTTYRTYAAKTLLFGLLGLVAGAVAGAYLLAGVLLVLEPVVRALAGLPRTMTRPLGIRPDFTLVLGSRTRWVILLGGGAIIGLLVSVLSYVFRWRLPSNTAEVRRRSIEEGLPRTTAFMFALSRGGMEFPQILRILGRNRDVYGEAAREMSVAVREMDLFGRDMITALRRMGRRTPSDQFKTFTENLTSVLGSGSTLPTFLSEQYERFREEAKERQNEVLELLATIAEAYVTVLVAGMLFLITILLVFGLTTTDTLWALQLLIYVMIPLANVGFAVYLQQKLDALGIARRSGGEVLDRMTAATPVYSAPPTEGRRADGGLAADRDNRRTMALYDRVGRLKTLLRSPFRAFLWDPVKLLWLTVPAAVLVVLLRSPAAFQADGVAVRTLDDYLVQSLLFVLVTYAVVRELYKRRIDRIEAATPELLERLASLNEAGMSVVEGLDRVREGDLGALTPEVERMWRDIEYGATVDDALIRFGRRVRTTAVTRVVTLLTNAMRASGDMGPVLRIASEQSRAEVKLRRGRRQQMFTYLVVIYVSFLVFLVIIVAVNEVLVPALPETVPTPEGGEISRVGASPDAFSRFGDVNQAAYTLVFFHAALLQAVCAGFVAGQLGEGSLRDGAKHAAVMLTIAYLAVVLLSSPVASVSAEFAVTDGDRISNVDSVDLSEGGFVAVYDDSDGEGVGGQLLGHTGYLPPGTHSNLIIPLQNAELTEDTDVRIVVHRDTDGDRRFGFTPPSRVEAGGIDRPYEPLSDGAAPGVTVTVEYLGNGN
jgi:flagellar protein FlaJ